MFKKSIALLVALFVHFSFYAQSSAIDSLKELYSSSNEDTSRYWYRNLIAEKYFDFDQDTAKVLWTQLEIELVPLIENAKSKKRSYQRTLAEVKNSLGAFFYNTGNLNKAIEYWNQSIALRKEMKDDYGITLSYLNMGFFYYSIQDLNKAVDCWQKAEVGAEKINNLELLTAALSNLGGVYSAIQENQKARIIFEKLISLKLKNKTEIGLESDYFNLAMIYLLEKNYDKAWVSARKAKEISAKYNYQQNLSSAYFALGELHTSSGNSDSAFYYYNLSYQLNKKNAFFVIHSAVSEALAKYYNKRKEYKKALAFGLEAYEVATNAKSLRDRKTASLALTSIYQNMGDVKNAFAYFKKYVFASDSLENMTNKNDIFKKQLEFDHEREKLFLQKEQEKRDAITNEEKKNQRIILYAVCIVLALLLLLTIMIYKSFKQKHKANLELESKNKQIAFQKHLVDEKQKEILDSIQYAKRIQDALLANKVLLKKHLPNHSVYFQPKDIVSGDFYWATEHNNNFYLAVCDSTGHGVPGAFMSLLNMGFLSEAIKEKDIDNPAEILNYVRKRLIESISSEGQKDGMDGILIKLNLANDNRVIEYAAANNEPVLVSRNNYIELEKDKMPVGLGERMESFKTYKIQLAEDDTLYLYTDGYADQFGGPKGKKFKYKQLNETLLSLNASPIHSHEEQLKQILNQWKGELEQVDDICVIGIRL